MFMRESENEQLLKVIAVMIDGVERTTRRLEAELRRRYGEMPRSGSVCRRLSETKRFGRLVKSRCEEINGKAVLFHKLVPVSSVSEVAQ